MKTYFAERGITSTSATTIANYAQERKEAIMSTLRSVSLVDEFKDVVGVDCPTKKVKAGITPEQLSHYTELAAEAASYDRLCAWLREAVKAKEALLIEARNEMCEIPYDAPVHQDIEDVMRGYTRPVLHNVTEEEVLSEFSVAELAEYYGCNSEAAVYGNLAHQDAPFNEARREFFNAVAAPYEVDDTLITQKTPTCTAEQVDQVFAALQAKQRHFNAQFNSYKRRIKNRMDELSDKYRTQYETELRQYRTLRSTIQAELMDTYKKELAEYDEKVTVLRNEFETAKAAKIKSISDLKIVIPKALEDIFARLDKALTASKL